MDKETAWQKIRNGFSHANNSKSSNRILWKLLVPLVLAAVILISSFSIVFWWQQNQQMTAYIHSTTILVSEEYERSLEEQSSELAEEINWILKNDKFKEAMRERDAEQLMANSENVYQRLVSVHHVTHFYIHGPDRVNILRFHNPEQKGDFIDRFTIREAERTGTTASGIELGPMGTFTLRVVKPVYSNETLIGYVELGKEIEDILHSVAYKSDSEIAVLVYKDKLNRDNWENGMEILGRDGNWSRYPTQVLIYSTMPIPTELDPIIQNKIAINGHITQEITPEIESNGKTLHLAALPLMDASGIEVGYMIIMKDITDDKMAFATNLKFVVIGSIVIFGLLFFFYFTILNQTDRRILANEKELVNSEEKLRTIFEGAVEGIKVADVDTQKFRYVNPALCRMLGYAEEELLQMRTIEIHPKNDLEQVISELGAQERGEKTLLSNIPCQRKDGTTIYVDMSIFYATIDGIKCTVGFYTDVTDLKKLDEEMQDAKLAMLAAEKSNRIKSEFLATMSHELRTPLNSIIGFSNLILEGEVGGMTDTQKKFLGNISTSGKHLLSLINNVLDLSMIEAGKVELNYELFSIYFTIDEVKQLVSSFADKKGLKIELSMDEHLEQIYADKVRFKQILLNLASNAIKFTPQGGKITISSHLVDNMAQFTVTDTGIGISEENQSKLFQPFTQLDSGINRLYEGTGVGLSLVKRFVELHQGRVWFESEIGIGTSFTFELPLQPKPNK